MSADLLRRAAAKLRDSHRYDGIKVDSDSKETLLLLRDLLAAREPLAAWLEQDAERFEAMASNLSIGPHPERFAETVFGRGVAVARAVLGEVPDEH